MGRATLVGLVLAVAAAVAGCSSSHQDSLAPPTLDASASSPPSPSISAAPRKTHPPVLGQKTQDRTDVHVGRIAAAGRGRAVADTLVHYMEVRLQAYHDVEVDQEALARVARGRAFNDVQAYVAELQGSGHHTVGEVWVDVSRVRLRGPRATVVSCMPNATADADRTGRVVEGDVASAYAVRAKAREVADGEWAIESVSFRGVPRCGA